MDNSTQGQILYKSNVFLGKLRNIVRNKFRYIHGAAKNLEMLLEIICEFAKILKKYLWRKSFLLKLQAFKNTNFKEHFVVTASLLYIFFCIII